MVMKELAALSIGVRFFFDAEQGAVPFKNSNNS